jgi:RNA polymerase sigma-70 factor (ECF subfamily)
MPEAAGVVLGFDRDRRMGRLAAAFRAAQVARAGTAGGAAATDTVDPEPPGLEETLEALVRRGRARHPELPVDAAVFAAHLGACGAAVGGDDAALHAEDLYLACAGLRGDEAAVRKLRSAHRSVIIGYLRQLDVSPAFVDEVEQRLWDGALVGNATAGAKLATYSGQGALAGWVGIGAQRIALMMRRHEQAEERAVDRVAADADVLAHDPELAFIKDKLRSAFQRAISLALDTLEDRERMIYRLHLVDGLTVESIGQIYAVSHSTVSRWLAKARDGVIAEARRLLRDEMQLSPDEFDSVAGLVASQLDLSVSRILRAPQRQKMHPA